MFLVQSYKTVTAWKVTPLQESCNSDKIYRKTVEDLRVAWFEARGEAQTMLVQCDADIVQLKQGNNCKELLGVIRLLEKEGLGSA